MMRKIFLHSILLSMLMVNSTLAAQETALTYMSLYDRFGIGVRCGVASHLQASPVPMGWETMVDVQYAHYWRHDGWREQIGLIVGASAGISRSTNRQTICETKSFPMTEGSLSYTMDYTAEATIREQNQQIQVEIPVLLSMVMHNGWFLNVGPRLQLPMATRYKQDIENDKVSATYSTWSQQAVVNSPTTGQFTEATRHSEGEWKVQKVNLLVGAETGYEYMFNDKNRLNVGVYGHVGVLPQRRDVATDAQMVHITPPTAEAAATVSTSGWSNTCSPSVNYFAAGIRLAYYFVW